MYYLIKWDRTAQKWRVVLNDHSGSYVRNAYYLHTTVPDGELIMVQLWYQSVSDFIATLKEPNNETP